MVIKVRLKEVRERLGITQIKVAEAVKINRVQYNQYENDYFNIPIKHLVSLADYFDTSVDYLLCLNETKKYLKSRKANNIQAGQRLKEWRKENKLTQVKLAEILNTTFSNIAFYEKGRNLIATPFLYTICKKYNISADYILGKIDDPKYLK